MKHKLLSVLTALALVLTLLPTAAFATDSTTAPATTPAATTLTIASGKAYTVSYNSSSSKLEYKDDSAAADATATELTQAKVVVNSGGKLTIAADALEHLKGTLEINGGGQLWLDKLIAIGPEGANDHPGMVFTSGKITMVFAVATEEVGGGSSASANSTGGGAAAPNNTFTLNSGSMTVNSWDTQATHLTFKTITFANGTTVNVGKPVNSSNTVKGLAIKGNTEVINNGTITVAADGELSLASTGKLTNNSKIINNGKITAATGTEIKNVNEITNNGEMKFETNGKLTGTGTFNLSNGTLTAAANLIEGGKFVAEAGETLALTSDIVGWVKSNTNGAVKLLIQTGATVTYGGAKIFGPTGSGAAIELVSSATTAADLTLYSATSTVGVEFLSGTSATVPAGKHWMTKLDNVKENVTVDSGAILTVNGTGKDYGLSVEADTTLINNGGIVVGTNLTLENTATFTNHGTLSLSETGATVIDKQANNATAKLTVGNSDGGVTTGETQKTTTYTYKDTVSGGGVVAPVVTPTTPTTPTTTPGTETTTNTDGSTTTTNTAADGTVTQTTTATDGSTTETVVKPDGSSTVSTKAADGSTTETVKNADGSGKETVKTADGAETVKETAADGSTTSEGKDKDGTTAEAKTDAAGNLTEAKADVTAATVATAAAAAAEGETPTVTLPVEVPAATTAAAAAPITIDMPATVTAENPVKVEIPVENVKTSTVVVVVNEDGTEEIVKDCTVTEDGVVLGVDGDVTVKVVDNAKTFTDAIPAWAEDSVDFVTAREIFNGTDLGTFEPTTVMSRGAIAQVLFNFDDATAPADSSFADATGDNWWDDAANWAGSVGIASGDDYNGADDLTREDLALMLYKYAQYKGWKTDGATSLAGFPDADKASSSNTKAALEWAVGNGIMNGTGAGLNPTGSATRAEVATMIARFVNYANK